jgi:HSP20 family protein
MIEIDDAINQVEKLYQAITGRPPPSSDKPYAPIPAEKDPVRQVEEEMDRLLERLGQPRLPVQVAPAWMPPLALLESTNEYVLALDLPGVRRDQVEVLHQGNAIVVSGTRQPLSQNGQQLRLAEQPLGRFRRVVPLPLGARMTGLTAQMRDGILEIRVPRETAQQPAVEPIPVT